LDGSSRYDWEGCLYQYALETHIPACYIPPLSYCHQRQSREYTRVCWELAFRQRLARLATMRLPSALNPKLLTLSDQSPLSVRTTWPLSLGCILAGWSAMGEERVLAP
ncbi:MAG: hypothetical protein ACLQU2_11625, partial [Candidatus Binataceae bacterium]